MNLIWIFAISGALFVAPGVSIAEDSEQVHLERQTRAFNQSLGFELQSQFNSDETGTSADLNGTALGQSKSLIHADVSAKTDFYINGLQFVSIQVPLDGAALTRKVLIPTIKIRSNILTVPAGPLLIKVEGGFLIEGSATAKLTPVAAIPVRDSSLIAELDADIDSSALLEGSAALFIVRGRVLGKVKLADVHASFRSQFYGNGNAPVVSSSGFVEFLSGSVSAYADVFNFFRFKWKKFWGQTLYQWKGECYDFSKNSQSEGACSAF